MRTGTIVTIIVLLLLGPPLIRLAWITSKDIKQTKTRSEQIYTNLGKTIGVLGEVKEYAVANTDAVDKLMEQLKESDKKIAQLEAIVLAQIETIVELDKQLAALPTFEVPTVDKEQPQDFEDCVDKLTECREMANDMIEIIGIQGTRIELMQAKLDTQDRIIAVQYETIEIQKRDNQALRDAYEDMVKDANRKKWVGYVVGIIGLAAAVL